VVSSRVRIFKRLKSPGIDSARQGIDSALLTRVTNTGSCLDGTYLPMQLADWLLVEVALLLIGLTHTISLLSKPGFDRLGRFSSVYKKTMKFQSSP
jgi:hypothetical protein